MPELLAAQWAARRLRLADTTQPLGLISKVDVAAEQPSATLGLQSADRDRIWQALVALYRTGIHPGISLCVRRHGQVWINRAIGHASGNGPGDHGEPRLMTTRTPVCLFSASKPVVAMLIHHLADEGRLSLTDPVSRYLPAFRGHGKEALTLHQILCHRSGLARLPLPPSPELLFNPDALWAALCSARPDSPGSSALAYHALSGGLILARVVEAVSGNTLSAQLDQVFRQPMDMRFFHYGMPSDSAALAARHYATGLPTPPPLTWLVERALGGSMEAAAEISADPRWLAAVIAPGNLYATGEEVSRFFQMLLDGGRYGEQQLLSEESIQAAIRPAGPLRFDRILCLPMRYSAGMMLGMRPMGLFGWQAGEAFGHLGLINKFAWADPSRDIAVALLTTGLSLVNHHLPALARLMYAISEGTRTA